MSTPQYLVHASAVSNVSFVASWLVSIIHSFYLYRCLCYSDKNNHTHVSCIISITFLTSSSLKDLLNLFYFPLYIYFDIFLYIENRQQIIDRKHSWRARKLIKATEIAFAAVLFLCCCFFLIFRFTLFLFFVCWRTVWNCPSTWVAIIISSMYQALMNINYHCFHTRKCRSLIARKKMLVLHLT